ncbi:uncharacterized protein LOC123922510 [Trifolium pratense]|uniref:uncharacterized protein LOC123922510 n=1 Tax=Trifolium pratense TaxID=57577 RepID=UPI001E695FE2|nr:uncharacterized protein LOC123922510 [Trifolium pratense]
MDHTFNKTLLVILSISSLLLSSNAVPSSRVIDFISTSVPAAAPKSSFKDYTSTSSPAEAPSSIDFISKSFPAVEAPNSDVNTVSKVASNVARVATIVDPEILKICVEDDEDRKKHCIETLSKLFESPFDIVKALEIEVNATLGTAKSLSDTFVKLINDPNTNKTFISALDSCHELCDHMLDAINHTLEILPQQNFADAYNSMCSVLSYKASCDANFEIANPDAEMPWDAQPLIQSTVICVDILNRIVNNHKI